VALCVCLSSAMQPIEENKEEEVETGGPYLCHSLSTGATPVPLKNGKRAVQNFDFHYQGWNNDGPIFRDGATRDNMFPQQGSGFLDGDMLHKLGLHAGRMREADGTPDALFFQQLILPIHHIDNDKVLTVPDNPRKGFYSNVSHWTNLYTVGDLGTFGGGYGQDFESTSPSELLKWDGTVVMDGVLGGSNGSFLSHFQTREGNESYHAGISKTFAKSRWLELKRSECTSPDSARPRS